MSRRVIQRRKIHEEIAEHLIEDIRQGVYGIDEELPSERELMEEFGVGRPAVREAISKLALMGLIDIRPGARAKVCPPTISRLIDEMSGVVKILLTTPEGVSMFQEVRLFLEVGLVRRAAREATPDHIQQLRQALEENELVVSDQEKFARSDLKFHNILAKMTGNTIFTAVTEALSSWLIEQRRTTLTKPGQTEIAIEAHREIFYAIEKHDPDQAEEAMVKHLEQVHQVWHELS